MVQIDSLLYTERVYLVVYRDDFVCAVSPGVSVTFCTSSDGLPTRVGINIIVLSLDDHCRASP